MRNGMGSVVSAQQIICIILQGRHGIDALSPPAHLFLYIAGKGREILIGFVVLVDELKKPRIFILHGVHLPRLLFAGNQGLSKEVFKQKKDKVEK